MVTETSTKLPPLYAVRLALGLSMQDAAIILNDSEHPALKIDDDPSEELGLLSEMLGDSIPKGELYLDIKEPDGTTFKRWLVTHDGYLREVSND